MVTNPKGACTAISQRPQRQQLQPQWSRQMGWSTSWSPGFARQTGSCQRAPQHNAQTTTTVAVFSSLTPPTIQAQSIVHTYHRSLVLGMFLLVQPSDKSRCNQPALGIRGQKAILAVAQKEQEILEPRDLAWRKQ